MARLIINLDYINCSILPFHTGAMMKILHTADIHLREFNDERWKALRELIAIGQKEKIDVLAISGDLFDKGIDAERLRPRIRELFSKTGFKILVIPGNHDESSLEAGLYFGEDVIVLNDTTPQDFESIKIIGIPYESVESEEVFSKIQSIKPSLTEDTTNILMYHGELLDMFFSREDLGDEGQKRYMPIKASYLDDLKIDYVLAGHFHTRFDSMKLANGGWFIYPGSPVSITKTETGQRKANLLTIGKPPSEYPLDTFHYEKVVIEFDPFIQRNPFELVNETFQKLHPQAKILLSFEGYINSKQIGISETQLHEQLIALVKGKCVEEPSYHVSDIKKILNDDLFQSFRQKVEEGNYDEEQKKKMLRVAIQAMMEALA
jgi:DNA repair exonuclease SbcCD nuclease subunit